MNGKILVTHGATTTHHIRDPNIVKTKGNRGKVGHICKKEDGVIDVKKVGHTIWKYPQATIPHTINHGDMVYKILYVLLVNVKM